ncbi:MAG TPA: hydroxymethylbilane synthase [Sandaracinaceae bacterium LLY-WYZ-13_1]|nr:hydroxymethylbilane synthase [Sandaracinaceae bacterium LLY-WYZ-13_1]
MQNPTRVRIATRRSPLALAQTRWVAARIRAHRPDVEVEEVAVSTKGDRVTDKPLATIGGKALFVGEVEAALVEGRADLAVHSMKDVPTDEDLADGHDIVCVPEREDPRDALVSPEGIELSELSRGVTVGTSSLRRSCQLHAARPDLRFAVCRGNVGTRLSKMDRGDYAAIVLAFSGLKRLGLDGERALWPIPPETSIPAVGQGALGIEGKVDDEDLRALLGPLEHGPTRLAVEAERAYLGRLQGSCTTPIAAFARFDDDGETRMRMEGMVGSVDGQTVLSASIDGYVDAPDHAARLQQAVRMGVELAEMQLDRGAAEIIHRAKTAADPYVMGPYRER